MLEHAGTVVTRLHAERDVQPIPAVDGYDRERQRDELVLSE
jgi:hypothetical protein